MKLAINQLTEEERLCIKGAVSLAKEYWPNAGGSETPREHIRTAFARIRNDIKQGIAWHYACARLEQDAYVHADM